MSVRGFNTGIGVERYDYNALDNVPLTTNTRVKGDAEAEYREGDVNLTKANIGLGNVDNTSDADKPISTAQQRALDDLSRQINDETTGLDTKAPVILETASGAIANFSDGANGMPIRKLVAQIEPVQDLHGYDHPWPAGGGKNLLVQNLQIIKAANPSGTWNENVYSYGGLVFTVNADEAGNIGSITISGTVDSSDVFFYFFRSSQGITLKAGAYICSGYGSGYKMRIGKGASDTIVGNVAPNGGFTLDDDSICSAACRFQNMSGTAINETIYPMIRLASETDATFEPYANICPINGRTGLSGKRTGKNVLQVDYRQPGSYSVGGVTIVNNGDGTFTCTGTNTSGAEILWQCSTRQANDFYGGYFSGGVSADLGIALTFFNSSGTYSGAVVNLGGVSNISNQSPLVVCSIRIPAGATVNGTVKPMIRLASETDATFEPYKSAAISVNWQSQAGTVYGGTVDVISGKLVVDRAGVTIEASDNLSVTGVTQLSSTITRIEGVARTPAFPYGDAYVLNNTNGNYSHGPYVEAWSSLVIHGYSAGSTLALYIPASANVTDATTAIAWLKAQATAGTPIQMAYPLATPIEYQLTPQEVTTLLGSNVVYTDVGPVSVTAPRDTKMYVDNKIAEAVATALNA